MTASNDSAVQVQRENAGKKDNTDEQTPPNSNEEDQRY